MYDGEMAPEFDWIEIAPGGGGPGMNLFMGNDTYITVDLPFPFQYYGEVYTQATIGSHGWMEFGATSSFFPNNMPIPHIVPPDKFVGAMWDDLAPANSGQVCKYYDSDNDRFVVEWYVVPHAADPSAFETFQIVLLDPQVYPTLSGDGEIIVNYLYVSHRLDYCTVGIENADATDGIEYLFNDDYDPKAMPLANNFAIKFSTAETIVGAEIEPSLAIPTTFALDQNYPNPFNPTTTFRFALPKAVDVQLAVYDVSGRLVETLVNGWRDAGYHNVSFDASGLSSGVYLYRLEAGSFTSTGKMVLMK
jgi:hypothetical protein